MSSLELQMTDLSSARSSGSDASLDEVRRLIALALARYDADKTGMVDYALESAGGQIVSTRCSKTYAPRTRKESVWGIPLWYSNYSPRTVIQVRECVLTENNAKVYSARAKRLFRANAGPLKALPVFCLLHSAVMFVSRTSPTNTYHWRWRQMAISIRRHIICRSGCVNVLYHSCTPLFIVQGYQSEHDPNATMIAEFNYDTRSDDALQTFEMDSSKPAARVAYPMVELRVLSNYGHPKYTCLYRLRVHGKRVYPQYGQEQRP